MIKRNCSSKVAKSNFPPNKVVYVTSGESVISVGQTSSVMADCNHKEADTRVVVHILHALEQGIKTIVVRTVGTDVIVILIGVFFELTANNPLADIWVAFGTGKNFRLYSINAICTYLGNERTQALPIFHALTGCDTTSAFRGKGKKSAWQACRCRLMMKSLRHLSFWLPTLSSIWILTQSIFREMRG